MKDYQRMSNAGSENQVKTALNDSSDGESSQSKIQENIICISQDWIGQFSNDDKELKISYELQEQNQDGQKKEDSQKFQLLCQDNIQSEKSLVKLMEEVKNHRKKEQANKENQAEDGEKTQVEQKQKKYVVKDQEPQKNIFTSVQSFPEIYKIVLGTSDGDIVVLSAIDFSYENSYQTENGKVIDLVASKKHIFSLHEGGLVCKLNISSKKLNDFEELETVQKGQVLAMKVSPNKRWLAYIQELKDKVEEKEKISFDLVIKDLEKFYEKSDDLQDSNQNDKDDQAQSYKSQHEGKSNDNSIQDEIRYTVDARFQYGKKDFNEVNSVNSTVHQVKDLFQFTSNSKNIVARTDLSVVTSFSVDKSNEDAVVEKLCGDNCRVIKLQILEDNLTLVCMSGGDKNLVEEIKIINLGTTEIQKNFSCSDPFDFCCSSDGKMIFVVDRDNQNKKTVLKGYDLKSQVQLINQQNSHNNLFTIFMSLDNNFLYLNYFDDSSTLNSLNYLKLEDQKMFIEENDVIMDDKCEFLMQHNRKTGYAELWDLSTNLIKAVYPKSYPRSVSGEYFYCIEDLKVKTNEKQQVFRVRYSQGKDYKQEVCTTEIEGYIHMVQVTKDNKFLYLMDNNDFKIIQIEKKEQTDSLKYVRSRYQENYVTLQLSNDEKFILYASDNQLFKYFVENGKFQKEETTFKQTKINWFIKKFDAFSKNDDYLLATQYANQKQEKFDLNQFETVKIKGLKKDKILHSCFIENDERLVTMDKNQLIFWKINEDNFEKLEQVDKPITPVYGHNNKLTGLRVDERLHTWSKHLIYQLSGNFAKLAKFKEEFEEESNSQSETYLKSLQQIQGPYNRLFPFVFGYFETIKDQNNLGKIAIIKHMLSNVIQLQGFTLLSYFAQKNEFIFIKEALKYKPMYFRNYLEQFPLYFALKNKSQTSVNMFVEFVANDKSLIELLNHNEVCELLEFSPSNLPKLINNSITTIIDAPQLGVDVDESKTDFHISENIDPDELYDLLCDKNAKHSEKRLVVYKRISFKLNLDPASKDSIRFHECLDKCTELDVFCSDAIKKILEYKWQNEEIQAFSFVPFFFSFGFVFTLVAHAYHPGYKRPLVWLLIFTFYVFFYEKLASRHGAQYLNKSTILIGILTPIYCFSTMYQPNQYIDYILPVLNLLSWYNFTLQCRKFDSIRAFMVVLVESVVSIKAFFAFIVLMLCTFTFTLLFEKKVKTRWIVFDKKIQEAKDQGFQFDMTYNTSLYESKIGDGENEIKLASKFADFFPEFTLMFYDTYLKMLGEFGDVGPDDYNYFQMVIFILLTFVLCITLLNLIIALMSSAFEEFKEKKDSKEQRELNRFILLTEVKLLTIPKNQFTYLIWMEYLEENLNKKSEITQINDMMVAAQDDLKKINLDASNQDDKIDKMATIQKLLKKDLEKVSKEVGDIKTSLGDFKKEVGGIKTSLDNLINLITKDKESVSK